MKQAKPIHYITILSLSSTPHAQSFSSLLLDRARGDALGSRTSGNGWGVIDGNATLLGFLLVVFFNSSTTSRSKLDPHAFFSIPRLTQTATRFGTNATATATVVARETAQRIDATRLIGNENAREGMVQRATDPDAVDGWIPRVGTLVGRQTGRSGLGIDAGRVDEHVVKEIVEEAPGKATGAKTAVARDGAEEDAGTRKVAVSVAVAVTTKVGVGEEDAAGEDEGDKEHATTGTCGEVRRRRC